MANTYTQLFVHLVIVVQDRQSILTKELKEILYPYISGIITNRKHKLYVINGMHDHIHILVSLSPDDSISDLVKEIKRASSVYINNNQLAKGKFSWQSGYAAFSCSKSTVDKVIDYINNQEKHHTLKTFSEELVEFFDKYDIKFDKQYLFDVIEENK